MCFNIQLEKSQSLICFFGDIVNMGTPAEVIRYCEPGLLAAVALCSSVLRRKCFDGMGVFDLAAWRQKSFKKEIK